ncbi:MAG: hypothetical protein FJZ96_14570, partial [Chloroflexi bacterium]|nr:hypothetical protein [Chloroflexota bacterium]
MVIFLDWFSVLLLMGAAAGLLVLRNWRWSLILLAAIYLGVFWLVSRHWPVGMAAVKLVTGWMAAAVLGISQMNAPAEDTFEPAWPEGRAFRLLVAGLAVAVTAAIAPAVTGWLGVVPAPAAWGGALLISLGVAHLGMTARPMRVALGLLTLLAGFE